MLIDDGHANQGSGHLQLGFRPEPTIVYIWGLSGSDRAPKPSKKMQGEDLHLFGWVWKSGGPVWDPKYKTFSAPAYTLVADGQSPGSRGRRISKAGS